jgi:hypothetical protein
MLGRRSASSAPGRLFGVQTDAEYRACSLLLDQRLRVLARGVRFHARARRRTYVAPPGGAIVFSCSLLHEATAVTRGTRYAFLPFLYDDAAARVREQNLPFLDL